MYLSKANIEVTRYIERINTFEIFDYSKEVPYRMSYEELNKKVSKEDIEASINSLSDYYHNEDFVPSSIFDKRISKGSFSEKIMATILFMNDVQFQYERKLEGSKHRFDFYIDNNNKPYVIEVNGAQHYERGESEYKIKMYESSVVSDCLKSSYCERRGVPLYFVDASKPSFEFIMDSIDWYGGLRWLVDYLDRKVVIDTYSRIFGYPY